MKKEILPVSQSLDMSTAAIFNRRQAMAMREADSPLHKAANALATLQCDGKLVDVDALEQVLSQRLKAMDDDKSTFPLQEMLYGEALVLNRTFTDLTQQANAPDIHPDRRHGLTSLALKAQRQSRAVIETLANMIMPRAPQTLIQNNLANKLEINSHEG